MKERRSEVVVRERQKKAVMTFSHARKPSQNIHNVSNKKKEIKTEMHNNINDILAYFLFLRFFYSITIEIGLDSYGNEGSFIYFHISQVTTGVCDLFSCVHYHNGSINFPLLIKIHSHDDTP